MPFAVRGGTCGNRTHVDHMQVKRLQPLGQQAPPMHNAAGCPAVRHWTLASPAGRCSDTVDTGCWGGPAIRYRLPVAHAAAVCCWLRRCRLLDAGTFLCWLLRCLLLVAGVALPSPCALWCCRWYPCLLPISPPLPSTSQGRTCPALLAAPLPSTSCWVEHVIRCRLLDAGISSCALLRCPLLVATMALPSAAVHS